MPASRAIAASVENILPSSGPSASVRSAADAMWTFGTIRTWVGLRGAMSWKARIRSSSATFCDGISPAMIRQNRQSGWGERSKRIDGATGGFRAADEVTMDAVRAGRIDPFDADAADHVD